MLTPPDVLPDLRRAPLRARLAVGSAYILFAAIIGQGFALMTSIIYARLLGKGNLGVLSIYSQLASIAVLAAGLGLETSIAKFVAQLRMESKAVLAKFLATVLGVTLVAASCVTIALVVVVAPLAEGTFGRFELGLMIRLTGIFLVVNSLGGFAAGILRGLQAIRRLAILGIIIEATTVPVAFVSISVYGLVGVSVSGILLVGVTTSLLLVSARRSLALEGVRIRVGLEIASAKMLFAYSMPLLASALVLKVALWLQTSLVALNLGYGDTGLLRVATTIAGIVAFAPAAITVPLLPALSEMYSGHSADDSQRKLTTIVKVTAHIGIPLAVGVGLFGGFLIQFFYGTEYAGASFLCFVLAMTAYLDMVRVVAANSLLGEGRTTTVFMLDSLQMAILITSTLSFLTWFGLVGAGYASLLSSVVYFALVIGLLGERRRMEVSRLAPALLLSMVAPGMALAAILFLNGQTNYLVALAVFLLSIAMSWTLFERSERLLMLRAARDLLRMRLP